MPTRLPAGFSDAFASDATKQTQWKAFLTKNQLQLMSLPDVVRDLRQKLLQSHLEFLQLNLPKD